MKKWLFTGLLLPVILLTASQALAIQVDILSTFFMVEGSLEGTFWEGGTPTQIVDTYYQNGSIPVDSGKYIELSDSLVYLYAHSSANFFSVNACAEAHDDEISGFSDAYAFSEFFFNPISDFSGLTIDYSVDIWGYIEVLVYDVTSSIELYNVKYSGQPNMFGPGCELAIETFSEFLALDFNSDHSYYIGLVAYKSSNEDITYDSFVHVKNLEPIIEGTNVPEPETVFLIGLILFVLFGVRAGVARNKSSQTDKGCEILLAK